MLMPYALCLMPYAAMRLCSYALCPTPYALCLILCSMHHATKLDKHACMQGLVPGGWRAPETHGALVAVAARTLS